MSRLTTGHAESRSLCWAVLGNVPHSVDLMFLVRDTGAFLYTDLSDGVECICQHTDILYLRDEELHSDCTAEFLLTSRPILILRNDPYGLPYKPDTI